MAHDHAEILELLKKGLTRRQVCERLGCSRSTVDRAKQAANRRSAKPMKAPEPPANDTTKDGAAPQTADELASFIRGQMLDRVLRLDAMTRLAEDRLKEALESADATSARVKDLSLVTCMLTDKVIFATEATVKLDRSHGTQKPVRARFRRKVVELKAVASAEELKQRDVS